MREQETLLSRIIIDPKVMVGKPVIKGTRLTVQHILGLLGQGMTITQVLEEYKNLNQDDIYACLVFAQKALESTTFSPMPFKA